MKVKRLTATAKLLTKANLGDLGFDLYADESHILKAGHLVRVHTGIAIEFPDGLGGIVKDRSSMAAKGLVISGGVIDSGYRGEIIVLLRNVNQDGTFYVTPNEKIAQLVLIPIADIGIEEVLEIDETDRGVKGFGSSGR